MTLNPDVMCCLVHIFEAAWFDATYCERHDGLTQLLGFLLALLDVLLGLSPHLTKMSLNERINA